jgi:hypothetical protein
MKAKAMYARQLLKDNGIDTTGIVVEHYLVGYGECYTIYGNNELHDLDKVKTILQEAFEDIKFDPSTGDIMPSGNTYVIVCDENSHVI